MGSQVANGDLTSGLAFKRSLADELAPPCNLRLLHALRLALNSNTGGHEGHYTIRRQDIS